VRDKIANAEKNPTDLEIKRIGSNHFMNKFTKKQLFSSRGRKGKKL